jgi:hypothetical protein
VEEEELELEGEVEEEEEEDGRRGVREATRGGLLRLLDFFRRLPPRTFLGLEEEEEEGEVRRRDFGEGGVIWMRCFGERGDKVEEEESEEVEEEEAEEEDEEEEEAEAIEEVVAEVVAADIIRRVGRRRDESMSEETSKLFRRFERISSNSFSNCKKHTIRTQTQTR